MVQDRVIGDFENPCVGKSCVEILFRTGVWIIPLLADFSCRGYRQLYSYIILESLAILAGRRLRDLDPAEAEVDSDGR